MAVTAGLNTQARDRVAQPPIQMIDASATKVERETETAASRMMLGAIAFRLHERLACLEPQ
jgi:hypothetical protein